MSKVKVTEKNFRHFGSWALITGAAGGMGQLYAGHFARLGFNLVLVDIVAAGLARVAESVKAEIAALDDWRAADKESFKVLELVQDLSLADAADSIVERTDAAGIEVELLVNNAGILYATGIVDTPERRLSLMLALHCTTPLLLCRKYVPRMRARGRGYVLNVSSLAAWMPWPCIGMYSSTKRFVKDYSRSMRIELRGSGVSVTCAYFGAVDTPLIPLAPNLRKIAHGLGVMIWPERAVESAVNAVMKRRRGTMPGFINHLAKIFCPLFGERFLAWVYRRYGHYFANF